MTAITTSFSFESTGPSSLRDYFDIYTSNPFETASDLSHINAGENENLEHLDANIAEYIAGINKYEIAHIISHTPQQNKKSEISTRV